MPTVQEILSDIDTRYNNAFEESVKIGWLNTTQREVFREMSMTEILETETETDLEGNVVSFFDISNQSIEFDLIKSLVIDDEQYTYKDINDFATNKCYYKLIDTNTEKIIGIYPTPTKAGLKAYIYFEKRPKVISALTETPELREDYQEILKFGVFMKIAEARDDIAKFNNFATQYNSLLKQIKQEKYEKRPNYPSTIDVMKKRKYYGRASEVAVNV